MRHAIHPLAVWVDEACFRHAREGITVHLDWPQIQIGVQTWTIRTGIDEFITDGWNLDALRMNLKGLSGALAVYRRRSSVTTPNGYFEVPIRQLGDELKRAAAAGPQVDLGRYILFFGGGEGATPAWDDFCTGMLLADRILARLDNRRDTLIRFDENFMAALRGRTTEISFWQLFLADGGYSSLRIECLIRQICQKPVTLVQIVRCFDLGHTSGSDIVSGACHYLTSVFSAEESSVVAA